MTHKKKLFSLICLIAIATAIISAWMAHVLQSSPAFQADFSFGLKETDLQLGTELKPRAPSFGFVAESIRTLIIGVLIFLSIPSIYPKIIDCIRVKTILIPSVIVALIVVPYIMFSAPYTLASNSKIWSTLSQNDAFWINRMPEGWNHEDRKNLMSQNFVLQAEELKQDDLRWIEKVAFRIKEYGRVHSDENLRRMYVHPYMHYLGYALANFVILTTPFLVICYCGARKDYLDSSAVFKELDNRIQDAAKLDQIAALRPCMEKSYLKLSDTLDRYLWLILLLVLVAFYEAKVGYLTLSNAGLTMVILTFVVAFSGYAFLAPCVLGHHNAIRVLKFRLIDIEDRYGDKVDEAERKTIRDLKGALASYDFSFGNSLQSISKLIVVIAGLLATINRLSQIDA